MQMSRHIYLLCCYVYKICSSLNCSFDLDASTYLMAVEGKYTCIYVVLLKHICYLSVASQLAAA